MEIMKSSKAIAVVSTALFLTSLVWLLNTQRINGSLHTGLQDEKLKSESLLSEKLLLEKDIHKIKAQLLSIKTENGALNNLVTETSAKLKAHESEFNRLKKENASLLQIKKQRQELVALRSNLENELQSLRVSYADMEARNKALNHTVASLQERNQMLTNDLNRAMFASIDYSQIQALRGKSEKLTVRAKKTNKLVANFEVPASLKNISFRILDANGNVLTQKNGIITSSIAPSENSYIASSDAEVHANKLQKVQMEYIPKEKLRSGIYTVEILNENLYAASLKIKLK
jgi:hypothetical protein